MKKRFLSLMTAIAVLLGCPQVSRADMFGGDVAVLTQILINAVQQLIQLKQLVSAGEDSLSLMRDINRGIDEALGVLNSVGAIRDPGVFRNLGSAESALRYLLSLYGDAVPSDETHVQQQTDQSVAEAITLNNSIYAYADEIDRIGEEIKEQSAMASPKGAEKLTAQSLGVLLHVMDQSLRAQATGLKLQAQAMAIQNRKDKQFSRQIQSSTDQLNAAMSAYRPEFQFPRL